MQIRLFSFLACLFFSISVFAQLPSAKRSADRAQNRAENKVNNKVDRAVDSAVDDVFNGLFGKKKKKTTTQEPTASDSDATQTAPADQDYAPFGQESGNWEAYTNERSFSFTMEYVFTKKNGKQETNSIDYAVVENAFALRMNDPEEETGMRLIMDTQTGKTTTVTTDKKGKSSAMRMKLPNLGNRASNGIEAQAAGDYTVERTGERQVIDGYDCEKIVIRSEKEDNTTTAWITQDIDLTWQEMFKAMTGFAGNPNKNMPNFSNLAGETDGITIKAVSVNGKQETIEVHYKNIKLDGDTDLSLLNLDGIEVMDIGF